jgi:rubrerythrin
MTVWSDLEKSIAMAEASRGNYLLFATDSDEEKAKQVFKEMAEDMERHVTILESRRDYLAQNNQESK